MADAHEARILLCGRLVVELDGVRREGLLPGVKGRALVAYLVLNRSRTIERDELLTALWGDDASPQTAGALRVCLSKVRRALGEDRLEGKTQLTLALPGNATVDVEVAQNAIHRAESHVALQEWPQAFLTANNAESISARPLLPGLDLRWLEEWRRRMEDIRLRALECHAAAALGLGGPALNLAEQSARHLTELAPYRESGYALLMSALQLKGNVAEALLIYERMRLLLREELGIPPGPTLRAAHMRLLGAAQEAEPAR